jgi:hypothetical protein
VRLALCDVFSPLPKSATQPPPRPSSTNNNPRGSAFYTSCISIHSRAIAIDILSLAIARNHRGCATSIPPTMSTYPRATLFNYLPPPAECLALLIGTLELLPFGVLGLRNPSFFADGYGLPIADTPASSAASAAVKQNPSGLSPEAEQQTKKALVAAIAARNVQNGVLLLTFGLVLRDRRSLGVVVLAGLVATVADTVIVRAYGVKDKVVGHYVGVFNSITIGGSLLYWGRNDPLW